MSEKVKLTFEFDSQEIAHDFAVWLSEQGEQEYWQWMSNAPHKPIAVNFQYHGPNQSGSFLSDMTIRTSSGTQTDDVDPYEENYD